MKKNIYIAPSIEIKGLQMEPMMAASPRAYSMSTTQENKVENYTLSGANQVTHGITTGTGSGINAAKEGGLSDWDDL